MLQVLVVTRYDIGLPFFDLDNFILLASVLTGLCVIFPSLNAEFWCSPDAGWVDRTIYRRNILVKCHGSH